MFRVSGFVRDRHLASVLHALEGKISDIEVAPVKMPEPEPKKTDKGKSRAPRPLGSLKAWPAVIAAPLNFSVNDVKACDQSLSRTAIYKAISEGIAAGKIVQHGQGRYSKVA